MTRRRGSIAFAFFFALLSSPAAIWASPWTLPQGRVAARTSTDVQLATSEFLPDGTNQRFPLNGEFFGANLRAELRYGLSERLEIGASISASHLNYDADEVFLAEGDTFDAQTVRQSILSFDRRTTGVADIHLFLRNRLTPIRRWVLAYELDLKLPTGYEPPAGTFEEDDPGEQVIDDVALGDGQTDITGRLLFGAAPVRNVFLRVDAGFRVRTGDPGHQVLGSFKVGGRVSDALVPFVFIDATHTITEGRPVGLSFTTPDPDAPAEEFDGGGNSRIEPIELRLDRTFIAPGVGSIITVGDQNIDVSYSYIVYGQNVAQAHVLSIGSTLTLDTR